MDTAELKQAIQQFTWYQSIHLGGGFYTPGKRSPEYLQWKLQMMQLPEDLSGKSVLDIGCNEGFYAIEAKRRGASRVIVVDKRESAASKFSLVKKVLNHDIEFHQLDVCQMDESILGTFDVVLFLAVFHHLKYPFVAMDKLASVTSGVAIMEVPVIDTESSLDSAIMVRGHSRKGRLRLIPNRQFLIEMLQRAGFREIEMLGSHSRQRYPNTPADSEKLFLKAYK